MLPLILLLAPLLQHRLPESIQPQRLASPSGEWSAQLNPSSKRGDGPSHVTVSHGAETAWTAELPFTFWKASLADSGHLAGYGFTEGPKDMGDGGDCIVSIFGPDGHELLHESAPLTWSRTLHARPNPNPRGLFLQPELDRFVVRVEDEDVNRSDEEWRSYRLSTGEPLGRTRPKALVEKPEALLRTLDARPIPGTPLTLVQWFEYSDVDRGGSGPGTRFVLVDGDWKPVWELDLAGDYVHPDEAEADRRRRDASEHGGILGVAERQFELRRVASGERATYRIDTGEEGEWAVWEWRREPYDGGSGEPPALPRLELRELATIPLQADPPSSAGPVRDLVAFDIDAAGRPRCVRTEDGGGVTLLSLDERGATGDEVRVDALAPEIEGQRAWHALDGGRWLFTLSPFGEDVTSRAWLIDESSGAATEVSDFAGPTVEAVSTAPDGGFVVLGSYPRRYTLEDALIAFDRKGMRRWEIVQRGLRGTDDELLGAQDVAVGTDGSVLVLDNVRHAVQVFHADGSFDHLVELELASADGSEPFLTGLRVEPAGSWLICEFLHDRPNTWHRVDDRGQRLGGFALRREDGSTDYEFNSSLRVDAQGALWTTDEQAVYAVDPDGTMRPRYGASPKADRLEEPCWVAFDRLGRILVGDRRSRAIHLFASSGKSQGVWPPEPADFTWANALPSVSSAADGRLFLLEDDLADESDRYLEFAPDGRRVGWVDLGGDRVAFAPDGGRWSAHEQPSEAAVIEAWGPDGQRRATIPRRPNGDFFLSVDALECASDGSLYVLTGVHGVRELELDVFSHSGEPQRSIDLGAAPSGYWSRLSQRGRWLAISSFEADAILVDLDSETASLVHVDGGAQGTSHAFALSPDGSELWCATLKPLALHRYALPEGP